MKNHIQRRSQVSVVLAVMLVTLSMIIAFGILTSCKKLETMQKFRQEKSLDKSVVAEAVVAGPVTLEAELAVLSGAIVSSNQPGYTGSP